MVSSFTSMYLCGYFVAHLCVCVCVKTNFKIWDWITYSSIKFNPKILNVYEKLFLLLNFSKLIQDNTKYGKVFNI